MKTINYKQITTWMASVVLCFLTSCSSFLDVDDDTKVSNDEIFSTIGGVAEALNGTYYLMGDFSYYGCQMMVLPGIKGGNLNVNDLTNQSPFSFNYIPSYEFSHQVAGDDDYSSDIYASIYAVINAANNIINSINSVTDGTEKQKVQALAEAKAIRALAHFDLARLFAQPYGYTANAQHIGIAYLEKNLKYDEYALRGLLYDNYESIIWDLLYAESNLGTPLNSDNARNLKGYFSKAAAQALLARIYLYKQDWNKAIEYANKVINSGAYILLDQNEVPSYYENNMETREDIFIMDNNGRNIAAPVSDRIGIKDNRTQIYLTPSEDIRQLFDQKDIRGSLFGIQMEKTLTKKWVEFAGDKDHYTPIIRLAELYLIRAEASMNLPSPNEVQARSDLDRIKQRANPEALPTQLSGTLLKEDIFNERRRELCFEGHLFFDIVRQGRNLNRVDCNALRNVNMSYPSNLFILPIPKDAMNYNPYMIQNPGY
ncbi:RagB/SusD family nutrient uptake outer membrane protein [Halosquirtibacter xylanolyticus]|uniref:RagB/SusD family nutrient uptake outer membrane protein n=1 Tax=Halosquirtibacter xylanolyticus TaxID=3374599 RepID=UPI0037495062|nr:RagB/SusD family nutrient uptake outer membrane protein [Prolixibacteraceae bacterium]